MLEILAQQLERIAKAVVTLALLIVSLFGGEMKMGSTTEPQSVISPIVYPVDADTNYEKLEFLYQAQETLRFQHNEMGRQYREGIITNEEWQSYLKNNFEPKSEWIGWGTSVIGEKLGNIEISTTSSTTGKTITISVNAREYYEKAMKQSTKWTVNLDTLIK